MNKNSFFLIVMLFTALLAGVSACSRPSAPLLDCVKGMHQEGDKCVPNQPMPAPATR